jgi:hypothetical protein
VTEVRDRARPSELSRVDRILLSTTYYFFVLVKLVSTFVRTDGTGRGNPIISVAGGSVVSPRGP